MMMTIWKVSFWHHDSEERLISTTCPESQIFDSLFSVGGSKARMFETCNTNRMSVLVADSTGFLWIGVPSFSDDVIKKLFVIGPVFASEISESGMLSAIRESSTPTEWRTKMIEQLKELPIIQHTAFIQFGIMLHYIVTKEVIESADMAIVKAVKSINTLTSEGFQTQEGEGAYRYERKIMKAIEDGNIAFKHPSNPPKVGKLSRGDPTRQAKNEILTYIVITSRAAMRGGMSEETAYGLADQYFQMVESERDISLIYSIGKECYNDFLQRMHKLKLSQGRSREIQTCLAYIESNLHEKIDYGDMAKNCGYSRNYLSVKFKSEMGMSMVDYITEQRVEQAKFMLRHTKESITGIAASLKFSSNSYFGQIFHKLTGTTPSEYRNGIDGK